MPRRYIRLHAHDPAILTARQYEEAQKELWARHVAGDVTIVERIVASLLQQNRHRYEEIKNDIDGLAEDELEGPG